jgi:REP element-mobilizing transposase RayT
MGRKEETKKQPGRLHHNWTNLTHQAPGMPSAAFEFTDPRKTPFVDPKSRDYLPHLYKEGGTYFVTFRLWDAVVPKEERQNAAETAAAQSETFVVQASRLQPSLQKDPKARAAGTAAPQQKPNTSQQGQTQKTREEIAAESEPPLRLGSCLLAEPRIAEMVQNSVKHFHGRRYYLHAWCVMGNHLHVVYTAMGEHAPHDIHHSWKSYTAHQANTILNRTGTFWESEGFDHLVRSIEDLEWFIEYVENNPVAAGLCRSKEDWRWSSAGTGWDPFACGAGVPPA